VFYKTANTRFLCICVGLVQDDDAAYILLPPLDCIKSIKRTNVDVVSSCLPFIPSFIFFSSKHVFHFISLCVPDICGLPTHLSAYPARCPCPYNIPYIGIVLHLPLLKPNRHFFKRLH
jgi:hypothetical protein